MPRMPRRTWLIATALALFAAAPARAAAPVDLGVGTNPSAVVDPAGTAHIVFESAGGQTYCRLPRNAPACDILTPLPLENRFGELKIFRRASDGALLVVQAAEDDLAGAEHGVTWLRYSPDAGATWAGPVAIGTGLRRLDAIAVANDGQSVFGVSDDVDSFFFQATPFGAPEPRRLDLNLKPDGAQLGSASGGDVVQTPQGRVLVAIDTDTDTLWRAFSGGDPYNQAAWQPFPAKRIRGEGTPSLSSGPRGTYLMSYRAVPAQRGPAAPFAIRAYDSRRNRWRAPRAAAEDRLVFGGGTLAQDARGRLHLLWATQSSGHTSCIVYARSGTRSSSWFGRSTTLFRTTSGDLQPSGGIAVAAGADGHGVAVWSSRGAEVNGGHVYVTALKQRAGRYHRIRSSYDRPYC